MSTSIVPLQAQRQISQVVCPMCIDVLQMKRSPLQNFAVRDVVAFTFHMNEKGQPRAPSAAKARC